MTKRKKEEKTGSDLWLDYLEFCNRHALTNWWFRGVSDVNHSLIPKVGRCYPENVWTKPVKKNGATPEQYEKRVFNAFQRRAHLELGNVTRSTLEWLAIAQHNGVPTRLLDWTPNPLIAVWFSINCSTPAKGQVARVYAVKVTTDMAADPFKLDPFDKKQKAPKFVISPHWHPRVRAQRGCFTVHPVPNAPVDLKPFDHDWFDIPSEHWRAFRRRLFYFGIDASTIMLDLTGLGESLAWQLEHEVGVAAQGY